MQQRAANFLGYSAQVRERELKGRVYAQGERESARARERESALAREREGVREEGEITKDLLGTILDNGGSRARGSRARTCIQYWA